MDLIWLIARLALAGVFAVAGVGKLLDLDGSVLASRGFGVPERFSRVVGYGLPIVELLAALLLLPVGTAFWGALLAILLLAGFIGGILNSLRKGETPDCHCFGQFHSEPIGKSTLIRNGVLLAIGALILSGGTSPGHSLVGWIRDESGAVQVLTTLVATIAIVVAVLGWLVVHLLGQNGRLLIRMDEIAARVAEAPAVVAANPNGALFTDFKPAPAFTATGLIGEKVSLETLRAPGKPILLFFSDPNCGPCTALMPDITGWQRDFKDQITVAMITRGSIDEVRAKNEPHGLTRVAIEHDRAVSKLFDVAGTPAVVLIDQSGNIASKVAAGAEAIKALVKTASAPKPAPPIRLAPGDNAPEFTLQNPGGSDVAFKQFTEKGAVLLFWNPGCGFCQRLLPDLHEWAKEAGPDRFPVVPITSGSTADAEKMDFAAHILMDQQFATGKLYGASGTPSGIEISADGKIASSLVVGGPAILELLRKHSGVAQSGRD